MARGSRKLFARVTVDKGGIIVQKRQRLGDGQETH